MAGIQDPNETLILIIKKKVSRQKGLGKGFSRLQAYNFPHIGLRNAQSIPGPQSWSFDSKSK